MSNYNTSTINVCLVGCVSAGKSTIINAFMGQDYAQCKIRRTTMMPNIFVETSDSSIIDSSESINKKIKEVNGEIYEQSLKSVTPFKLEDYGTELVFYVDDMNINKGNKNKICLYDMPGLNDAKTKQIYYDYLEKNFHKFNIILFVVDIQSGLNTSDEIDILNFLIRNIKLHKEISKKNINMLTIVNKADDMQFKSTNELEVLGELGEMFEQTNLTIKQAFQKESLNSHTWGCIPICGLDAHLYRMIKKYKDIEKISREHIMKIGVNDTGSKFRGKTLEQQKEHVKTIINNEDFVDSMIALSGFSQIENWINDFTKSKGDDMVVENILWELERIPKLTHINFSTNLIKRITLIEKLEKVSDDKYRELMKIIVSLIIFIKFDEINKYTDPHVIIKYYDCFNDYVVKNPVLLNNISKFMNFNEYPKFLVDRIIKLTENIYSDHLHPVEIQKFNLINLLESIGCLTVEVVDKLISNLCNNSRGLSTFIFGLKFDARFLIRTFEKMKISGKFLEFLRFFLMNYYRAVLPSEEITKKRLFFRKYEEIPMYEFLGDLKASKMLSNNVENDIKIYTKGNSRSDMDNLLELYYIVKSREFNDEENFINHTKPIDARIFQEFLI
jgi:GTP-binding protein EngB required for normal cell division